MPREGYRSVTLRSEVYDKLRVLAASRGMSVPEFIEYLLRREEDKGYCEVDFVGWLGLHLEPEKSFPRDAPIVEFDETDHMVFRCSACGSELMLASISVEDSGYGAVRLKFFCPECGRVYYRKFYAVGYRRGGGVDDIPRAAVKVFKVDVRKKLNELLDVILASLSLDNYSVVVSEEYVCIDGKVLEAPPVRKTMSWEGLSKEFLERYSIVAQDDGVKVVDDTICVSIKVFAETLRRVLTSILNGFKPSQVLEDGTHIYMFHTDYELKPKELLEYRYGVMLYWTGFMLRGLDALRSIRRVIAYDFDCAECMEIFQKQIQNCKTFNEIAKMVEEHTETCSTHAKQLAKLVKLSRTLPVFTPSKTGEKVTIAIAKPREEP